ncbi:hypothetical protein [Entomospira culicis]|uniref:Lipoprotein n=1 Tax=Entomospira culicis TaxID=2719989 RepID=A0A968GH97_9SPIO|nr:hypothetical protein [Entomospira culicis]NIZ18394.1 hypothetical protein [Entomospira culicis]NIZ68610.1 hypothetical protein [Entomospira culicis]WDI37209.1 hypothetical protein PVA46_00015 [Entomospira culicis]WDI38838.1 hypothetical protein PVA47_00025 [Entomospira culicis]
MFNKKRITLSLLFCLSAMVSCKPSTSKSTPPSPPKPNPIPNFTQPPAPLSSRDIVASYPFLPKEVIDTVSKEASISLRYLLIPEAKLQAFREDPNKFVPMLNQWSSKNALSRYNYLMHYLEQPAFFLRPHLHWIQLNFTDPQAPTISYVGEDIDDVINAPLQKIGFHKPFNEPWDIEDLDIDDLNLTFPELSVKAGDKFYFLILLRVQEVSHKPTPYYTYTINLDNLEEFLYTMA